MSTVTSTNSYGGLSGLMSGMDTDSMVTDLLMYSQAKIDKQTGLKTQAESKQSLYRDVISSINSFKDKFFNSSYGASITNNLSSTSFFNQKISSLTSGSGVKIHSTSTSAIEGDMAIKISQLASSASLSTGHNVQSNTTITGSEGALTDEAISNLFNDSRTVVLNATNSAGEAVDVEVDLNGVTSQQNVVDAFNTALSDAGVQAEASLKSGSLSIEASKDSNDNPIANVSVKLDKTASSDLGLQISGMSGGVYNSENNTLSGASIDAKPSVYSFDMSIDGVNKSITISSLDGTFDADGNYTSNTGASLLEDFSSALKTSVKQSFGDYVSVDVSDTGTVEFNLEFYQTDDDGNYVLDDDGNRISELGHDMTITMASSSTLGITPGSTTSFSTSQTLSEFINNGEESFSFEINGEKFEFSGDTTVASMMNSINNSDAGVKMSYSSLSGSFSMQATSTGAQFGIDITDNSGVFDAFFGAPTVEMPTDPDGNFVPGPPVITTFRDSIVEGTDAKFSINGVETSRSSNVFTIEGITMELTAVTPEDEDPAVISTVRDTDTIYDAVVEFVDAYNELLTELNGLTSQDPNYKDYLPLTDAQKAEMSDREVELWEEKTTEGLLYNDTTISGMLQSLRTTMYTSSSTSSLALYQIGIETTTDYNQKGILQIDESKLREMIVSNTDEISALFTDPNNGLSKQIETTLNAYANTSSGNPGILVQIAGVEGTSTESDNSMSFSISDMANTIDSLTFRYDQEKARYWSQFTAMETVLSSYSTSMSLFTSY